MKKSLYPAHKKPSINPYNISLLGHIFYHSKSAKRAILPGSFCLQYFYFPLALYLSTICVIFCNSVIFMASIIRPLLQSSHPFLSLCPSVVPPFFPLLRSSVSSPLPPNHIPQKNHCFVMCLNLELRLNKANQFK